VIRYHTIVQIQYLPNPPEGGHLTMIALFIWKGSAGGFKKINLFGNRWRLSPNNCRWI